MTLPQLDASTVASSFDAKSGVTTVNVTFLYQSTGLGVDCSIRALNAVPNKPPGMSTDTALGLKTKNATQSAENRTVFNVTATYSNDLTETEKKNNEGGGDGGGGGDGKPPKNCNKPPKETTSFVTVVKDAPVKNGCGDPILPSPQIEVMYTKRTVTLDLPAEDIGQVKKDLVKDIGKIDPEETQRVNDELGIDMLDNKKSNTVMKFHLQHTANR